MVIPKFFVFIMFYFYLLLFILFITILYCSLLFQIGLQRYNYLDFFAIPRNNDLISLGLSP